MSSAETRVEDVLGRLAEMEPMIRSAGARAEAERRLGPEVSDALREAGCYRLFRPRVFGGLELDPVSGLRVVEEVARIDSAAGWNVAQANAQEPMGAWLSDEAVEEVAGSPDAVLGGSFFPPRRAAPTEGGYRVSGRCPFNSNCHNATWLSGLANIHEGGDDGPRLDDQGHPVTLLTFFRREEAEIVDNWDTLGMRGTGSHDVALDDVFIPTERAVVFRPLEEPNEAFSGPLHRLTIWHSIACNSAPPLGIARAMVDDFLDRARTRTASYTSAAVENRALVQYRFAKALATLESARAYLHAAFEEAWRKAQAGAMLDLSDRTKLQLACSHAPLAAAEAVDLIHSLVGTAGIRNDRPFARHFRDVHTLTQHAYVSENRFEAVGQVHFGLEPNWGFLHF